MTRTLALFGLFGVGNIGNEASLASAIAAARRHRPDADVIVVAADPAAVAREHGVRAVPMTMSGPMPSTAGLPRWARLVLRPIVELARWVATYRFLHTVDAVLVPGTGILDDFGMAPHQMPYELVRWSGAARLARTPWLMVGVGAGPIEHPLSRRLLRRTVLNADLVTYRDEASREYMANLGAGRAGAAVQPDVAFALPRPAASPAPDREAPIALGVMAYHGWANDPGRGGQTFTTYTDAMAAIAARLLSSGRAVRLVVGERSDVAAVERIVATVWSELGPDAAGGLLFDPIDDFGELLSQIASTDALIATRYHNVIAGLMTATPTISVGYADKNRDVMARFGLAAYCHDADVVDVDAVVEQLHDVVARGPELRRTLLAAGDDLARRVSDRFAAILGDPRHDHERWSHAGHLVQTPTMRKELQR